MDTQTIIYIIVSFVVGGGIAWLVSRRTTSKKIDDMEFELTHTKSQLLQTKSQGSENKQLMEELQTLKKSVASLNDENSSLKESVNKQNQAAQVKLQETEESLKKKYEELLAKVQKENENLDAALKLATEGKIDDSLKQQLAASKKSVETVKELEVQLDELRKQHDELLSAQEPLRISLEEANAKCTSLGKKIKKLEDEVEDAEEERDDLEKKLKKKSSELQDSQNALDESVRENKKLHSDLKQKQEELSDRLTELKRKSESIEFVQDVLSAPESRAQDVKALYKEIDSFEMFLKGSYNDCIAYLYKTYPELHEILGMSLDAKKKFYKQGFEEWAAVKRKSWLDKKTTVAFVGEFSAGKTSIVNRILSQDNPTIPLLPVSTKATTAIPTYIAGGITETYNFVTPDDKLKTINESVFKKVSKEVLDEIKGVSSLIKYFVMTYKNPNLNGLSILDTPGFNSNDSEDKARTIDVINECDALFWVFDVNAGTVNRSSRSLIKSNLKKPLYVVINKVDTKSQSEIDKVENLIRRDLSSEGLKVEKFIRFSSKAPLQDIMNPIKSIHHEVARDEFVYKVEMDIKELLNGFNNLVNGAYKEWQNFDGQISSIHDQFATSLQGLADACIEAADIPHWETHMFSKDRFEMDEYEGNHLIELLSEIANTRLEEIIDVYNEIKPAISEEQNAYQAWTDFKASWKKIDECHKEYNKVTKNLK